MKLLWCSLLVASVPAWSQNVATINELPSREFGHARLDAPIKSLAPNLVEGRELNGPSAIAFDTSVTPPILYVADTFNSRVLAWRNPAGLTKGNPADKVIGQRDSFTTIQQGPGRPGSDLPGGLARPVGLAVDSSGNLYVMDAANNRILRYPAPFSQTGDVLIVDLVIGQTSTTSGIQPVTPVSASTLNLNIPSNGIYLGGIGFDPQGNLWATDAGNHRVLRYAKAVLNQAPPKNNPAADAVIGQRDAFSNVSPDTDPTNNQKTLSTLRFPISLSLDPSGGLYVADSYSRVLYYTSPGPSAIASRVLGVLPDAVPGQAPVLYPNQYSLGGGNQAGQPTDSPRCIFTYQGKVFVCDTFAHRVARYESPAQWSPATPSTPSPAIATVVGQLNSLTNGCDNARLTCTRPNRGLAEPDATTLSFPLGGVFDPSGNLWISDFGNNRVLSYPPNDIFAYASATKVLGQIDSSASQADAFNHNAPNLVEGREVWVSNSGILGGAIVVDKNSNPPHLYIADTFNNRILGFRDARVVGADVRSVLATKADIVIGQPDLFRTTKNCTVTSLNAPCTGDPETPNDTGLSQPIGLALDAQGRLYVADSGNGRVLRFPAPFEHALGIQRAELVLGQLGFGLPDLTTSQRTMRSPYGLVVFTNGNVGVSDTSDNRVLIFRKPAGGGDFVSGQPASAVVGQSSFSTASVPAQPTPASLNGPLGLAADDSDRLHICDFRNGRVLIFSNEGTLFQGDASRVQISVSQPVGIVVMPLGDGITQRTIWVAGGGVYHIRRFDDLKGDATDITETIQPISAAIGIGLDSFNNLIIAETANRISFYFQKLVYRNAANSTSGNLQQVAPGMMMYVAKNVGNITADATPVLSPPWDSTVSGLQVLVNGVPSPIFQVAPPLIFIVVPIGAPTSGTSEFLITRPATGEILAAGTFLMTPAAPGFFTSNAQGTGQIAATNFSDGSVNGPQHPVARGEILTVWLTGQGPGFQGSAPPDGQGASGLLTSEKPVVIVNGTALPDANVIASAMTVYPGA
ncbi:MAG TPA: hypothetical protein VLN48_02630, partial [Bryobacteraceae bacterium]|nr:hypothetical protein [Bryobacteraceae bacterium]